MHLVLSGEGASDVGVDLEHLGPITKLVLREMDGRLTYSLIDYQALTLFSKAELVARAKQMKSRSRKGKKQPSETRYFYNNARALALLAGTLAAKNGYRDCQKLEDESGNDASPNSLKSQLETYLGEPATRELLNNKIDDGKIEGDRLVDIPSFMAFKERLEVVLTNLLRGKNQGG